MSFPARVFRVLIASPSDVIEEREIAVRTIQEWNNLNASERQVVILPLRWETHSAPEYGRRPQEIINRQVVDHCDLLIGIFWTRVGSPTGVSESGTVEEIERVAIEGKPVMLYFSQAKQEPEKIDVEQLAKLREFKRKTFPNALVESYVDVIEFRDKLFRQLELQLRTLLAGESEGEMGGGFVPPVTDIAVHFADVESGDDAGVSIKLDTRFIEVSNFSQIPDYSQPESGTKREAIPIGLTGTALPYVRTLGSDTNKDYLRQLVTYQVLQAFLRPVRFWLKNRGSVGARDVYIDINVQASHGVLVVAPKDSIPTSPPSKSESGFVFLSPRHPKRPDEVIRRAASSWSTSMEFRALQPQREIAPVATFLLGAIESCDVNIVARIYADTLPQPVEQRLELRLSVAQQSIDVDELIPELAQQNDTSQPER